MLQRVFGLSRNIYHNYSMYFRPGRFKVLLNVTASELQNRDAEVQSASIGSALYKVQADTEVQRYCRPCSS